MYIATPCQQYTVADVDRTKCAEGRYGSCCVWCWAMCSGKSYGCHLYGMKNRKACVLDIDMELPSVMSCRVLFRCVDTVCGVWYLFILCIFCIFIIKNSHVPNPWHNLITYQMGQSPSWEANRFSASQEIPRILWLLKVRYTFISLHDTTANINENWTVHHKAATELLWVLIKNVLEPLI